jgi:hypothetical protein
MEDVGRLGPGVAHPDPHAFADARLERVVDVLMGPRVPPVARTKSCTSLGSVWCTSMAGP